ncbi:hypothetical protein AMAG_18001 [Allomyces macrogynus ATCC 38327]|uniref:Tom7-domain-containing protein n=1 Tax=Allomyces macrogynus (strain ATCC 38327) TaxID=578462 RepID=A0A0L0S3V7_ALLM3|nr:hypothetical protein AMAG_18001 [Allomyces macrogynus ATCC 38327]|eukprot:KNE57086.1 hypothetical protein AMAG_18001 [Allomyces macrogynus ATCC 38327]
MFSEENKERFLRVTDFVKKVVHVMYLPTILYIGFTRSNPQPSFARLISPFA